jgi:integrase/recombinase XerD
MKTMFELLDEYIQYEKSLNYSPATSRTAFYNIRNFLKWAGSMWGIVSSDQLGMKHLDAWQQHLSVYVTTKGHKLKPRSVNKKIENIHGFLKRLAIQGYVPAALVQVLSPVKEPYVLPGSVLVHQQMRKLLDVLDTSLPEGYRNRALMEILYSCGIRAGEVLGLDVDKIDFRNATAMVTGKGRKDRVVPIGMTALKFLEGYVRAVRPYFLKDKAEKAMFLDVKGKRMPYHQLRVMIRGYAKKAGISIAVTPHTFRRSCTTEMLRGGAGMYHVKELLGHESLDTLKHYAKLTITDLKQAHAKCHPREKDCCQRDV